MQGTFLGRFFQDGIHQRECRLFLFPSTRGDFYETTPEANKKKFSAATIEAINHLSPDELETHEIIQSARVSDYVCPICGSGDGSNGTGMTQNPKIESHTSLHCFSCGKSFNPLQLCALHYGLEIRRDFPALVEKICADFEIPIEYEEFAFHSSFRGSSRKPRKLPPLDAKELKNIQADLNASVEPLKTFMKYQPYQKWRGFDLEFLLAHDCRLINDWFPPSLRDTNNQPLTPTSRMIIPSGESSYMARLTDQVNNYDIKARPFIKEKVHAGHKKLFNPDALQNEIVFVVEGYIDAMSLELAGFNCVVLGGCAEGYLLLDALDKVDKYPQIIILFDTDDAGTKAAKSLHEELCCGKVKL